MIELVVSGGQTGADRAGWIAAKRCGIATGGFMPRGFHAEDGDHPEFAGLYGAREHISLSYPPRTRSNVKLADFTAWFGSTNSPGFLCTQSACNQFNRPFVIISYPDYESPIRLATIIENHSCSKINVAGNRESRSPGIGRMVERYLDLVFGRFRRTFSDLTS